ncbi:MAG TPA: hypothetical protein VGA37_16550 [Gemmatimonadales bacterium]
MRLPALVWFRVTSPALIFLVAGTACAPDSAGPHGSLTGRLAIRPVFATAGTAAAGGVVEIAKTRVVLQREDGNAALDTLITVTPGTDSIRLDVTVALIQSNEAFALTLEFITPSGEVAFRGGPVEVRPVSSGDAPPIQVDVIIVYVGVGADAASVRIANSQLSLAFGDTATLTAEALNAQGQVIAGTPIAWGSLDTTRATVPDPATGRVVAGAVEGPARITATLLTGPADTLVASVVTTLVGDLTLLFHASGISDFFDGDSLESGRFFEVVDPVAMTVFSPLQVSRGTQEVTGLGYDPINNLVYVSDRDCRLIRVDPATGVEEAVGDTAASGTFCGEGGSGGYFKGLAFEPGTNRMLGAVVPEYSDGQLYEVDPLTAMATPLGLVVTAAGDTLDGFNGMSFQPGTGVLYVAGHLRGDALRDRYLMTVDVATLTATPIGLLSENGVASITFTSGGTLYAVTGDGAITPESLWTVNPATAALILVMPLGHGDDGEAIVGIPVQTVGAAAGAAAAGR